MIANFSDHAANERTFLAWVRTGIAVIAFGFVIERFNLFLLTLTSAASGIGVQHLPRLPSSVGRYEGLAFILGGIGLVILSTIRFVRMTRLLDQPETHLAESVRTELILSAVLVLLVTSYSLFMAFS